MIKDKILNLALEKIEKLEYISLSWGYTDGQLSEETLNSLMEQFTENIDKSIDYEELIEQLVNKNLLFEFRKDNKVFYRSRFAESIRLITKLRQLFPNKDWRTAPTLISDYRVDRRPRRYPKRDITPDQAVNQIEGELTPLQNQLFYSILSNNGIKLNLSKFQLSATQKILLSDGGSGIIVTSGTGSGKTLCFYLPAFLKIADSIDNQFWVKALAIYPRTELLKDQFSEAYIMARKIDETLINARKRPLIIGTLYGSTPKDIDSVKRDILNNDVKNGWKLRGKDLICPYMNCPKCEAELLWKSQDIEENKECLICSKNNCNYIIEENTIILTRQKALNTPPDILFTTSEMLNKRLADAKMRVLFGITTDKSKRAKMLLLDEVHTYNGSSGAHIALVLRRWRNAINTKIDYVGLSATLKDSEKFFSDLTGLGVTKISEISPKPEELEEEGAEYQLILRGDPVSQTSLLSTSIQTSMLLARLMDNPSRPTSDGFFGKKIFAFTDNLDITNRLFDDLKDAEAYNIFGRPDTARLPLASLREQQPGETSIRDLEGQRWRFSENLEFDLSNRLRISRTSSQDAGVDLQSNVIVATASLEVGFNDPDVGGVIQHKSPHNMAAFLQRKGRAGRSRKMRPWMVTILSDYGRDRLTFQSYERLIEPELPSQKLPIKNQYILRMHAAMALLDWLSWRLYGKRWLWYELGEPTNNATFQKDVIRVLTEMLNGETNLIEKFSENLKYSLNIDDETVTSLLWEAPRSIMLEVIPTLLRRLQTNWELAYSDNNQEYFVKYLPLPEFIPANLFSELGLPEVGIAIPPATVNHSESNDQLPIVQSLLQFVPGRVTRRFAHEMGGLSHWVPIDINYPSVALEIDEFCQHEFIGDFPVGADQSISVYRPWKIRLAKVNNKLISDKSNALASWLSSFRLNGSPLNMYIPKKEPWNNLFTKIESFLHSKRASISVCRYTPAAMANIKKKEREGISELDIEVSYLDKGKPAAMGFEQEIDGLHFRYKLPSKEELSLIELSPELLATSRSAFFRYLITSDQVILSYTNSFLADWVYQVYLSGLFLRSIDKDKTLKEAREDLVNDRQRIDIYLEVMRAIFSIQGVMDPDSQDISIGIEEEGKLAKKLREVFENPEIINRLDTLAENLWNPETNTWTGWIQHRLHQTMSLAILDSCIRVAPYHASVDTLIADPDEEIGENGDSGVIIGEDTLGGVGMIQTVTEQFYSEPHLINNGIEIAVSAGDSEIVAESLKHFLQITCSDEIVSKLVEEIRSTTDHLTREKVRGVLYRKMAECGLYVGKSFSISLNARLLKPGMNIETDKLILELINFWEALELKHQVQIDLRVFCYLAIKKPEFNQRIQDFLNIMIQSQGVDENHLLQILSGILWPRGGELRQNKLFTYNPFKSIKNTDTLLVKEVILKDTISSVTLNEAQWEQKLFQNLSEKGICHLIGNMNQETKMKKEIIKMLAKPIDSVGDIYFYPYVESYSRNKDEIIITFMVREVL